MTTEIRLASKLHFTFMINSSNTVLKYRSEISMIIHKKFKFRTIVFEKVDESEKK